MQTDRDRLRQLVDELSLIMGENMTLSTGTRSSFYFDCKKTTLNGEALSLTADAFLHEINKLPVVPTAIGGLALGADPIVAAVVLRAFQLGHPTINGSIARKEPKKHGTMQYVENDMPRGTKVVVVDDVITTGNSTATACDRLLEAGYDVVGIVALIDRESGGVEKLSTKYGCPVLSIFKKSDFQRIAEHVAEETPHVRVESKAAVFA